jgi:hypothetical protein
MLMQIDLKIFMVEGGDKRRSLFPSTVIGGGVGDLRVIRVFTYNALPLSPALPPLMVEGSYRRFLPFPSTVIGGVTKGRGWRFGVEVGTHDEFLSAQIFRIQKCGRNVGHKMKIALADRTGSDGRERAIDLTYNIGYNGFSPEGECFL